VLHLVEWCLYSKKRFREARRLHFQAQAVEEGFDFFVPQIDVTRFFEKRKVNINRTQSDISYMTCVFIMGV
jgi:hypothetical protein